MGTKGTALLHGASCFSLVKNNDAYSVLQNVNTGYSVGTGYRILCTFSYCLNFSENMDFYSEEFL